MRGTSPSRTAQYVAVVRAILTDRGWLDDPHAAGMLAPSMRVVRTAFRVPGVRRLTTSPFFAALATRIAWFDEECRRAAAEGLGQVVIVGAGYDSRAWRLAAPGVRWFEVDHPATQADKRRRAAAGGPTYVAVDLGATTVAAALEGSGFEPGAPTLFVIEGVTMYLRRDEVRELLAELGALASPGSRLAVNFAAPPGTGGLVERVRQPLIRLAGRASGESHRTFADVVGAAALVSAAGWHVDAAVALRDVGPALLRDVPLDLARVNPHAPAVAASLGG